MYGSKVAFREEIKTNNLLTDLEEKQLQWLGHVRKNGCN
jgi:hypothetical protein